MFEVEPCTSSKLSKCRVCGSFDAQFHFGAVACRSCAAFFRRFVNSRKSYIQCTCNEPARSSYACRLCRMKKCLAVGMNRSLVQLQRERNTAVCKKDTRPKILINHLVLRAFEKLERVKNHYEFANNIRDIVKPTSTKPGDTNCFKLSCRVREDFFLLSDMIVRTFPELEQLSKEEKNVLFTNFYPKWCAFESTMAEVKYSFLESWFHETASGDKVFALKEYYCDEDGNPAELTVEKLSLFNPFWEFMAFDFKKLLADIDFDEMEEMCVLALLFFDTGYSNLSPKSVEMCEKFRKCILRELKLYCLDKNKDEMRFFEILGALPLVERAEERSYEELQLCSLLNIKVDREYYDIMSASKSC